MSRLDPTNAERQARWQARRKLRFQELERRVAELERQVAERERQVAELELERDALKARLGVA